MKKRRTAGKIVLLIWLTVLSCAAAGCRTSPVLEQVVYRQNEEPDQDNEVNSMDNDETNEQEDETLSAKKQVEDADSKRDQSREDAVSGDGSDEADKTYDPDYEEHADSVGEDRQSAVGSSDSEKSDGVSAGDSSDSQETDSLSSGNGRQKEEQTKPGTSESENQEETQTQQSDNTETLSEEETENPPDDSGENDQPGGNGNLDEGIESGDEEEPVQDAVRQIVDARGAVVEVPENVDTVTATGEAAVIVEMLGGSGRLLASSGSFTGNGMASSVFGGQGFSSVKTWWDGNGSGNISSGNFESLLASEPDVCFEISGQNTFSSAQITALGEAGIAYVVLPSFSSIGNIKSAVKIVGDVLGDRSSQGGTNAPAIAGSYADWADGVMASVRGKGSAKYTLYISSWDSSAYWEIKNNTSGVWQSGYGAAVGRKNAGGSPLNDCMSAANLTNRSSDNVYINPLRNNYWLNYYSGGSGTFRYGENLTYVSGVGLGNEAFPAIVVADSSIRDNIRSDIHWQVYGWEIDGAGNSGFGFNDGNGTIIGTTIEADYDIYVNPSGVGSWTEGSVESPLEAAWLSCKFQNGCSMDSLRSMVSDFYTTFYHSGVNVSSVLGE